MMPGPSDEISNDDLIVPEGFSYSDFQYQLGLQKIVQKNLQHQHYWKNITLYPQQQQQQQQLQISSSSSSSGKSSKAHQNGLPRLLISGFPPDQIYIPHGSSPSSVDPQKVEFVLPFHASEKFSLKQWSEVFDTLPEDESNDPKKEIDNDNKHVKSTDSKVKRISLAVVADDSTVVYYIVHDGVVKPRQN